MRPITRKILAKIDGENGLHFDKILEILDKTSTSELKKSFQDDCLFQSDKYFANEIVKELIRYRLVQKEGNIIKKIKKEENR